ncbi:SAM hydrolase/SAM-dependent halogenase family protein [Bacillus chungangensis]|uniref:S-adenosylmethionine hydrolase n=1 Tax=Bacillus chungangensis TaxID=587633 RepID=A0ABT9WSJ5_9BACI|nr:S-adenosyl-l-methionine hydroxide adenosyltransferase family protein [Bacillus chungangensis]MDQ0176261.1 S-adenosylmethionine hydrolase [Bacillus chungangensis]
MNSRLVLQTDFGTSDGAVCAMYGVAMSVDPSLRIFDLTHDIPQYNVWEASYRLYQTMSYWPEETVFISVVDPGVGSERRSIVAKTAANQYIITPDNGTLTHMKNNSGIIEARIIDESINRLPHSGESYTFHGRDVYAYTGARLASKVITFEQAGPVIAVDSIIELPKSEACMKNGVIMGNIDILDIRFGNLWTNIDRSLFKELEVQYGDSFEVTIEDEKRQLYQNVMTFGRSFADSHVGEPLIFVNSLEKLGIAINQGSFAEMYHIEPGSINRKIIICKC